MKKGKYKSGSNPNPSKRRSKRSKKWAQGRKKVSLK